MPGLPWTPETLDSAVHACEQAAIALDPSPPGLELPRLAKEMTAGQAYTDWFGRLSRGEVDSDVLSPWARESVRELQRLVDVAPEAIDGDAACHGDLRPDNMIADAGGRTWICDWNWLSLGAAWTDLVGLLITAHADGLDADTV
jgi:aminoglycoside phosphotransferase (APT) family kinase protein